MAPSPGAPNPAGEQGSTASNVLVVLFMLLAVGVAAAAATDRLPWQKGAKIAPGAVGLVELTENPQAAGAGADGPIV